MRTVTCNPSALLCEFTLRGCDSLWICPQLLYMVDLCLDFWELTKIATTVALDVSVTAGAVLLVKISFSSDQTTSSVRKPLVNSKSSPSSIAAWRILELEGVSTVVEADIGVPARAVSCIKAGAPLNERYRSFIHFN